MSAFVRAEAAIPGAPLGRAAARPSTGGLLTRLAEAASRAEALRAESRRRRYAALLAAPLRRRP